MGQRNADFLSKIHADVKSAILGNIAKHYGITVAAAEAEVIDPEAEHIMDYVTGPRRNEYAAAFIRTMGSL